jgi:peptidoglycan/xylan/chitin deacetylase (PgdA/CDA1 family)
MVASASSEPGPAGKPTFALTFDTELVWGSFDRASPEVFARQYPDVRGTINAVLQLLDKFEVTATWAVVGHLFLPECQRGGSGLAHEELGVRPRQRWRPGDWYAADPCTDRHRDPLWYGDDVVDALQGARTPQEIGCHSFSHALYGDPAMTREAVDADLEACIALANARGIELRSFVFPRNCEGHLEALRAHGFRAYRGVDPTWHAGIKGLPGRAAHLIDQVAAFPPPVSSPEEKLPGLWNIPGSALLIHRTGPRRVVPIQSRIRKARAGLRRAAEDGGVFHLWTHPFNLASDRRGMVAALEVILREAVEARDRGELLIEPMAAIAERMSLMAVSSATREWRRPVATSSVDHGSSVPASQGEPDNHCLEPAEEVAEPGVDPRGPEEPSSQFQ